MGFSIMKRLFDRQLAIKFVLSGKSKDKATLQMKHRFLDFDRVFKVVKGNSTKPGLIVILQVKVIEMSCYIFS